MPGFQIRSIPRQHTAVVAMHTTPEGISDAMGQALGKAFEAVTAAGLQPAGPPFSRYFAFGESIEFEAGVPVAAPFAGTGDVRAGELGGCEAAVGMHVGPYDTLEQTYAALDAWLRQQGRTPSGPMWEIYLSDPQSEPDPANWRTQIHVPVS